MHLLPYPLIILGYILTLVTSEPLSYSSQNYHHRPDTQPSFMAINSDSDGQSSASALDNSLDKRTERYAFGLGRRAYTYTSGGAGQGVKRLPVYNFGLGKRARCVIVFYRCVLERKFEFDVFFFCILADHMHLDWENGLMMKNMLNQILFMMFIRWQKKKNEIILTVISNKYIVFVLIFKFFYTRLWFGTWKQETETLNNT